MTYETSDIAKEASTDPATLFSSSVNDRNSNIRDTGLILTKDQIKSLKIYEVTALALPTSLRDVVNYLGYRSGAGNGLEAVDFQKTFTIIHNHASQWNPLRTDLISVGDKLEIFAKKMQVYGVNMTRLFQRIDSTGIREKYNIETLEDLRELELAPGDEFPVVLPTHRRNFGAVLDRILQDVEEQEAEAHSIRRRLADFGEELATTVHREVRLKLASIDNNTLGADIKALQVQIDERAKAIDEKTKEYNAFVEKAVSGVFVNLALTIYASVQAEKVRKERNRMRKEQEKAIAAQARKNTILASLNRVRLDLQDLDLIVIDADIATKNLIVVWNRMSTFITSSREQADKIDNGLDLFLFELDFENVVDPWKNVEQDARKLLDVFEQADIEFRQEYGTNK
ncbi:MAG: alpha-xenorhabdolysin family binary toxin subunit A [Pseudomonas sp.]|uniref:alpha-xenorhabdolysin family binary toxin subunit A n=1 Tax=Pseudomonas sp. TaxID=306 RepID=UPI003D6DB203